MKRNTYGFLIGEQRVEILAKTEQNAVCILVKRYWDLVDAAEKITLLGEIL